MRVYVDILVAPEVVAAVVVVAGVIVVAGVYREAVNVQLAREKLKVKVGRVFAYAIPGEGQV